LVIWFHVCNFIHNYPIGEKAWLRVIENVNTRKKVEEYRATHGGRAPPEPFATALGRQLFPCFYKPASRADHLKMGAAMAARAQQEQNLKKENDKDDDDD
jgi:hypothetical protein